MKTLLKNLLTPNAGSCGCGRSKLCDVYEPKPKPKPKPQNPKLISSSSAMESNDDQLTTSTSNFSFNNIDCSSTRTTTASSSATAYTESDRDLPLASSMVSPCPKIVDSVAVVKDSVDPYRDFRQSMLQMIKEREIYSRDELTQLLQCFLKLNSPCHHHVIVKAFMEIWDAHLDTSNQQSCLAVGHAHEHQHEHHEHGSS